jgi:hypothetical protein
MSTTLQNSLSRAVKDLGTGRGEFGLAVTTRGAEASAGYKPKSWWTLGGYVGRTWSGSVEAGAKSTITWGKS